MHMHFVFLLTFCIQKHITESKTGLVVNNHESSVLTPLFILLSVSTTQHSLPVVSLSSHQTMQGKDHKQTPSEPPSTQQRQHSSDSSSRWQTLQHYKAPANHSRPQSAPAAAGTLASSASERPAWLSFLQGMLDAHQQQHLDGISISRGNSSIKHSKSSSCSSKHGHRKGHNGLAAPTAAVAAAAATVAVADDSSTADNDAASVQHTATPHAAWPVCWPYN
jgi:hypothetical protein